jgi:hypothetical protein
MKSKELKTEEISDLKSDILFATEILLWRIIFFEKKIKSDDRKYGGVKGEYKIHPESFLNICKVPEDLSNKIKKTFRSDTDTEEGK